MIVYVGGPIDQAKSPLDYGQVTKMMGEVVKSLRDAIPNGSIFRPHNCWTPLGIDDDPGAEPREIEQRDALVIRNIDLYACRLAHIGVFVLPKGIPTYGTVVEIEERVTRGDPRQNKQWTCVYTDAAMIGSAFFAAHGIPAFSTPTRLRDWLVECVTASEESR